MAINQSCKTLGFLLAHKAGTTAAIYQDFFCFKLRHAAKKNGV